MDMKQRMDYLLISQQRNLIISIQQYTELFS